VIVLAEHRLDADCREARLILGFGEPAAIILEAARADDLNGQGRTPDGDRTVGDTCTEKTIKA
jgi:hypothetical protein